MRAHIVGNEHKGKQLTGDRFLGEAVIFVDAAESVFHEKHTSAVGALLQIGASAKDRRHRLTDLLLPTLRRELGKISLSQLHREVAATRATTMA